MVTKSVAVTSTNHPLLILRADLQCVRIDRPAALVVSATTMNSGIIQPLEAAAIVQGYLHIIHVPFPRRSNYCNLSATFIPFYSLEQLGPPLLHCTSWSYRSKKLTDLH